MRGGLVAGTLFVLPGFLSILALPILYAEYRDYGLKPAVVAIVGEALLRVGRRALDRPTEHGEAGNPTESPRSISAAEALISAIWCILP